MRIIENNFIGERYVCPHCTSILELEKHDIRYESNCGELAGVSDGWWKGYKCPCCQKLVTLDEGSYE